MCEINIIAKGSIFILYMIEDAATMVLILTFLRISKKHLLRQQANTCVNCM